MLACSQRLSKEPWIAQIQIQRWELSGWKGDTTANGEWQEDRIEEAN